MKEIKLAIVGSRGILDYDLLCKLVDMFPYKITWIISGGAQGVDGMARRYALEHDIKLKEFLPDWQSYGRAAGIIRNRYIIQSCDYALILWDGRSRGTANDILLCEELNKPYYLHNQLYTYRIYSIGLPIIPNAKDERGWKTWVGMLKRVTTKDTYKDVKIDPSWLMFPLFLKWYISQSPPSGFEMDKDLLSNGLHDHYGPDVCVFLPKEINLQLLRKLGWQEEERKGGKKYIPVMYQGGKAIKGEKYDNEEDARKEYIKMKREWMQGLIWKYQWALKDDIKDKLLKYDYA